jgi:hypothetical protein
LSRAMRLSSAERPRTAKARSRPRPQCCRLVERDGRVRSFHVPSVTAQTLRPIMTANVDRASYLMTDESPVYWSIGRQFAGHGAVNHSAEEYVRAYFWHTNTAENYFSILEAGHLRLLLPRLRSPICIGTPPSSTSGTTTGSRSGSTTSNGPISLSSAQRASA